MKKIIILLSVLFAATAQSQTPGNIIAKSLRFKPRNLVFSATPPDSSFLYIDAQGYVKRTTGGTGSAITSLSNGITGSAGIGKLGGQLTEATTRLYSADNRSFIIDSINQFIVRRSNFPRIGVDANSSFLGSPNGNVFLSTLNTQMAVQLGGGPVEFYIVDTATVVLNKIYNTYANFSDTTNYLVGITANGQHVRTLKSSITKNPGGGYGRVQLNRNNNFAGTDSLTFNSGAFRVTGTAIEISRGNILAIDPGYYGTGYGGLLSYTSGEKIAVYDQPNEAYYYGNGAIAVYGGGTLTGINGDLRVISVSDGITIADGTFITNEMGIYSAGNGTTIAGYNGNDEVYTYANGRILGNNFDDQIRFPYYGAGTATFTADGTITSLSDTRLKNVHGRYSTGIAALKKIKPIVYSWNEKSGIEQKTSYIGFSAQNIKAALGEGSYGTNKDGYLSIQDRAILATLVNAVKEQQQIIERLEMEVANLKKQVIR